MSDELKIHISTPADTTGAKQTAKELQGVAAATTEATAAGKENATTTKEVAHELGGMAKAFKVGALEGGLLTETLHGNIGALLHLGTVLKGAKTAITASLAGLATFGAGIFLSALPTIIGFIRGAGDAAKDAEPKVDVFAEALKKAGEARLEVLSKELASLKAEAKGAADELERVFNAQKALLEARSTVAKSEIEANQTLTPQEREKKMFEAEQGAVDEQRKLEKDNRSKKVGEAKDAMNAARAEADKIKAEQQKFLDSAAAGETQAHNEQMEKANLERELKKWEPVAGSDDPVAAADAAERVKNMKARIEQIDAGTGLKTQAGAQRARAEQMKPAVTAAEQAANEAEQRWSDLAKDEFDPTRAFTHGLEDRARRNRFHQPEPNTNFDHSKMMDQFGSMSTVLPESTQRAIEELRMLNKIIRENGALTVSSMKQLADYIHAVTIEAEKQAESLRTVQDQLKNGERR